VIDGSVARSVIYVNDLGQRFSVRVEAASLDRVLDFFDDPLCIEVVPSSASSGMSTDDRSSEDVASELIQAASESGQEPSDDDVTAITGAVTSSFGAADRAIAFDLESFGPNDNPELPHLGHFFVDPFVPSGGSDIYSPRTGTYFRAQLYLSSGKTASWVIRSSTGLVAASGFASAGNWTNNMEVGSPRSTSHYLRVYGWGMNSTYSVYGSWRSESFSK
jgi:hypothetical protein